MKNWIILLIFLFHSTLFAQGLSCGTDELWHNRALTDPNFLNIKRDYDLNYKKFMTSNINQSNALRIINNNDTTYEIPVVFHVIHTGQGLGTSENPSDAMIQDYLLKLNQVFLANYPGRPTTSSGGVKFPIQFVLAKRTPSCQSTNGIVRFNASTVPNYPADGVNIGPTSLGIQDSTLKNLSRWDPTRYMNVWIVTKITGTTSGGGGVAGYAYFPGASNNVDGIVLAHNQVNWAFAHEVGHYFGLYHTFEDSDGSTCPPNNDCLLDGDRVCDTDPHILPTGCPTNTNSCTNSSLIPVTYNYMNYSSCPDRFTVGQRERTMYGLLLNRASLVNSLGVLPPTASNLTNLASPTLASCNPSSAPIPSNAYSSMGVGNVILNNLNYGSSNVWLDGAVYIDNTQNRCDQYQQYAQLYFSTPYSLKVSSTGNNAKISAWIDFDNNGIFNNTERVLNVTGINKDEYASSNNFFVPATTQKNIPLRMRVVAVSSTSSINPCEMHNNYQGQTEDFIVVVSDTTVPKLVIKNNDTAICLGDSIVLNLGGMKNYTFSPFNSVRIINDSTFSLKPTSNTVYTIIGTTGVYADTGQYTVSFLTAPSFNISGSNKFCKGDSTVLTFVGIDSVYLQQTYQGISILNANRVVFKPNTVQNPYLMTLKKANFCPIRNYEVNINALDTIRPSLSVSRMSTICLGDTLKVTESKLSSKNWSPTTNFQAVNDSTFYFFPVQNTQYILSSLDTNICPRVRDTLSIQVSQKPRVRVNGINTICIGDSTVLTAQGASSYTWSPTNRIFSVVNNRVVAIPDTSTTFKVIGNIGNCVDSTFFNITVGQNNNKVKILGKAFGCQNERIVLRVDKSGTNLWSPSNLLFPLVGDSSRVTLFSSSKVFVENNELGCISRDTFSIQMIPGPDIEINQDKNAICEGDTVNLSANTSAISFTWSPSYNIVSSGINSVRVFPQISTTYQLIARSAQGCVSSKTAFVEVYPKPKILTTPSSITLNTRQTISISASGANTYEWSPSLYVQNSITSNPLLINPDSSIRYRVIGRSSQGCIDTSYVSITVKRNSLGIDENSNQISFYPNPMSDKLTCKFDHIAVQRNLDFFDISGKLILAINATEMENYIDVSLLSKGVYFVKVYEDQALIHEIELLKK
ncbi:MAG: zinc-dependent metalloprotease [Chitinophagales bacterium]|jgi:hypothetical protein|nr:zinc-dependent metalloprotease [Chitinophagales bacterium]